MQVKDQFVRARDRLLRDDQADEVSNVEAEGATVPEEEATEVAELSDCEVGEGAGLTALFADDSDAHVGRLDHVDVVGAVSNRQGRLPWAVNAHKPYQRGLLLGRGAVDHEALCLEEGIDESLPLDKVRDLFDSIDEDGDYGATDHQVIPAALSHELADEGLLIDGVLLGEIDQFSLAI